MLIRRRFAYRNSDQAPLHIGPCIMACFNFGEIKQQKNNQASHFSLPMNILKVCNPLQETGGVDVGWGYVT